MKSDEEIPFQQKYEQLKDIAKVACDRGFDIMLKEGYLIVDGRIGIALRDNYPIHGEIIGKNQLLNTIGGTEICPLIAAQKHRTFMSRICANYTLMQKIYNVLPGLNVIFCDGLTWIRSSADRLYYSAVDSKIIDSSAPDNTIYVMCGTGRSYNVIARIKMTNYEDELKKYMAPELAQIVSGYLEFIDEIIDVLRY